MLRIRGQFDQLTQDEFLLVLYTAGVLTEIPKGCAGSGPCTEDAMTDIIRCCIWFGYVTDDYRYQPPWISLTHIEW